MADGFGTTTVDFGSFPGSASAQVAVTGQTNILTGSLVEAWLNPVGGTSDHSEDEHIIENIKVCVGLIIAGTGFTVFCEAMPPGCRIYGQWNVAFCYL